MNIYVCISVICVKINRIFEKNKDLPGKFIKKTKIGIKIAKKTKPRKIFCAILKICAENDI